MNELVAQAKMLVRRSQDEVFSAFVEPGLLCRFWLKSASGALHDGAQVQWQFMVAGAQERVLVTAFERPSRLAFTWCEGKLDVELLLSEVEKGSTVVSVTVRGFEEGEQSVAQVVNATEGFSIVLCDLKTFLESGQSANLVRDKAALIESEQGA
jgi:uncharacterized protein YndB with AHSA1/START domain